jgi:ABC-type uncharacterized transport system auxiliary subunit
MRLIDCSSYRKEAMLGAFHRTARVFSSCATAALLAAALSGCGSPKPIKYYQLTHPPTTSLSGAPTTLDASLMVRMFQTSRLYREDRLVYGGEAQQLGVYETQRWAEPPAELLQDALARGLRSSGRLRAVTTLRSDTSVDYTLTGHLYAFREVSGNGIMARLNYDVNLMDARLGKSIWTHTYNHDEPVSGKEVADVVAAMDKNVQQSIQEVQDGIVQALASYSRK